ncbi:MAG: FAD-dependent monooxygenase, partial [Bacteroidota bacterium]
MTTIDIIGAGIGGLTLAATLEQASIPYRIFEQSPVLKPVGAGINLGINAMQVYQRLGLQPQLEAAGHVGHVMELADDQGKTLSRIELRDFETTFKARNVAIHRGNLQEELCRATNPEALHLDKHLKDIVAKGDQLQLRFKDGSTYDSACIIGADGIHSKVRDWVCPSGSTIRPAGQSCWRGVLDVQLPERFRAQLTECWGRGRRFGFLPVDDQRVYWFAVKDAAPQDERMTRDDLVDYFSSFFDLVPQLLRETPENSIH